MIFQFKKFILSLLLVSALFCGLSVSAHAANAETYLYNGVEFLALPEWDKEKYPYATIVYYSPTSGTLWLTSNPGVYTESDTGMQSISLPADTIVCRFARYTSVGECWNLIEEDVTRAGYPIHTPASDIKSYLLWSNHDILDNHGSVYLAASDPVPAQPKYSPTLTSRTHSFTDTTVITEVNLMGLDPSKVYEVYWSIYDTDDNLLGHGVSSQIGEITGVETATAFSRIVNLQPGTTYRLYWKLFEDNLLTDANSSNTVTTLGLSPGDTGDSGSSGGSAGSGGTGSDFAGGEDDISGSQGDGNTGILMQILNKLSAIFDFLTGDKEVEDTPEQAVKDATSDVTQAVADTIFGENSAIKPTVDTVTDVASVGTVGKSLFSSNVSIGDFLGLFNDTTLIRWFSDETAADLNAVPAASAYRFGQETSESARIFNEHSQRHFAFAGFGGDD